MIRNKWGLALLSGLLLVRAGARAAPAADARGRLPIELQDLYQGLLRAAEKGDWEKLRKGIDLIEPVNLETDAVLGLRLNEEIHAAVSSKDARKVRITLRKVICGGARALLVQAQREAEVEEARRTVRQAFTEFLLLEPEFKTVDFKASRNVMGGFRRAYALAAGGREEFSAECRRIVERLDDLLLRLEGGAHE